jgi:hypothetical protein
VAKYLNEKVSRWHKVEYPVIKGSSFKFPSVSGAKSGMKRMLANMKSSVGVTKKLAFDFGMKVCDVTGQALKATVKGVGEGENDMSQDLKDQEQANAPTPLSADDIVALNPLMRNVANGAKILDYLVSNRASDLFTKKEIDLIQVARSKLHKLAPSWKFLTSAFERNSPALDSKISDVVALLKETNRLAKDAVARLKKMASSEIKDLDSEMAEFQNTVKKESAVRTGLSKIKVNKPTGKKFVDLVKSTTTSGKSLRTALSGSKQAWQQPADKFMESVFNIKNAIVDSRKQTVGKTGKVSTMLKELEQQLSGLDGINPKFVLDPARPFVAPKNPPKPKTKPNPTPQSKPSTKLAKSKNAKKTAPATKDET